eukprot:Opistho-2@2900
MENGSCCRPKNFAYMVGGCCPQTRGLHPNGRGAAAPAQARGAAGLSCACAYLQVKLLALTSLTKPAPQVARACSLILAISALSATRLLDGGAITQALQSTAATRARDRGARRWVMGVLKGGRWVMRRSIEMVSAASLPPATRRRFTGTGCRPGRPAVTASSQAHHARPRASGTAYADCHGPTSHSPQDRCRTTTAGRLPSLAGQPGRRAAHAADHHRRAQEPGRSADRGPQPRPAAPGLRAAADGRADRLGWRAGAGRTRGGAGAGGAGRTRTPARAGEVLRHRPGRPHAGRTGPGPARPRTHRPLGVRLPGLDGRVLGRHRRGGRRRAGPTVPRARGRCRHGLSGPRRTQAGARSSALPMRICAPGAMPSQSSKPRGANTRMVEPCWNQPISSPLAKRAWQAISLGPR